VSAGQGAESASGASSSVNVFVVGGAAVGALVVVGVVVALVVRARRSSPSAPLRSVPVARTSGSRERRVEVDAGVVVRDHVVEVELDHEDDAAGQP
jgi:hypothetical protein